MPEFKSWVQITYYVLLINIYLYFSESEHKLIKPWSACHVVLKNNQISFLCDLLGITNQNLGK